MQNAVVNKNDFSFSILTFFVVDLENLTIFFFVEDLENLTIFFFVNFNISTIFIKKN